MRLDILDERRGILRVKVDSEDDLWLLSLLIGSGDIVSSLTTRDVSLGNEKRRIPMVLAVKVDKIEFQPFTNRLRVHGIVVEGPDRFGVLGSHHTLLVGVGSEITIHKSKWDKRIVEEVLRFVRPVNMLLVAVDFDEYSIALLQMQGLRFIDNRDVSLPVSDEGFEEEKKGLVEELARKIVEVAHRYRVDTVVIGSPGNLKNEIRDVIENIDRSISIYIDTVANGGYAGIQELINRDVVGRAIKDTAIAKALEILEEFDRLLVKDINMVAYGINSIEIASEVGAIKKLVVVDEMLSGFSEIREKIEKILRNVVNKGGIVAIIPSDIPISERVKMLGGVIAILRYSIDITQLSNTQN